MIEKCRLQTELSAEMELWRWRRKSEMAKTCFEKKSNIFKYAEIFRSYLLFDC